MVTDRKQLLDLLVEWLEGCREAFVKMTKALDIPVSVRIMVPVTTVKGDGSLESHHEERFMSPAALLRIRADLENHLGGSAALPSSPSQAIYEAYGDRSRLWDPIASPDFSEAPSDWLDMILMKPLAREYVSGLASLDKGDLVRAAELANGLLDLVEGDSVVHLTTLPLAGLEFDEDPLQVGEILFRRLSSEELGALSNLPADVKYLPGRIGSPRFEFFAERWALEFRNKCPKDQQPWDEYQVHAFLLALQLLGFEIHGRGEAVTSTEPGVSLWNGSQVFRIARGGEVRKCTREDLQRALELSKQVLEGNLLQPGNRKNVALYRFSLGASEVSLADAIVDFAVCLEAVFLPDKFEGELGFRLAIFAALFLSEDPVERKEIYSQVRVLYDTRSSLVHGRKPPSAQEIRDAARTARAVAARTLIACLEGSWPSQENLLDLAVG